MFVVLGVETKGEWCEEGKEWMKIIEEKLKMKTGNLNQKLI